LYEIIGLDIAEMGDNMPTFTQDAEFEELVEERFSRKLKLPQKLRIRLTKSMTLFQKVDLDTLIKQIKDHNEKLAMPEVEEKDENEEEESDEEGRQEKKVYHQLDMSMKAGHDTLLPGAPLKKKTLGNFVH
jgi:hypothetical protein